MATLFTLEAIFAKEGDALLLHYGPWDDPSRILIDGGPPGVYGDHVRPRLDQVRQECEIPNDQAVPFRMVMVSHIDSDHIAGVLDLFRDVAKAHETRQRPPYAIQTLWHNSFSDLLGDTQETVVSEMAASVASTGPGELRTPRMSEDSRAVVASTGQGRELRDAAKKLRVTVNKPLEGLVMAKGCRTVTLGHGLRLTVVGPVEGRVKAYQKRWKQDLKRILKDKKSSAKAAAYADDSPFNLASICVLLEMKKKRILLTGDARGDYVIEGLQEAKLLKPSKNLHVDVLKVPHHGSERNMEESFFRRITAEHYVISADGKHGNPDGPTLEMIKKARGNDSYTIHFTFTADAHEHEEDAKRRKALKQVASWVRKKPAGCTVIHRNPDADVHSVVVDLLDPYYPE